MKEGLDSMLSDLLHEGPADGPLVRLDRVYGRLVQWPCEPNKSILLAA